jgi:DNA-binding transcriptional LysR family regulator
MGISFCDGALHRVPAYTRLADMDLTQLRTFVAVAEERHLTRAAERLHISQPAASAHIRALEEDFGLALFDRSNRGLELTSAGHALVKRAKNILDEALAIVAHARVLHGKPSGLLTIGSTADPVLSRLGIIAAAMQQEHPLINLGIQTRSSAATLQGVRNGELDAGFVLGEPLAGSLGCLTLRTVNYRIAGPAAWADTLRSANWEAISQLPWITTDPGNSYTRMMDQLFGAKGLQVNSAVQANNDVVIRSLIADGVGLCLVREDQAIEARDLGKMSLSDIAVAQTALMFVYQINRQADPLVLALGNVVRRVWDLPV